MIVVLTPQSLLSLLASPIFLPTPEIDAGVP